MDKQLMTPEQLAAIRARADNKRLPPAPWIGTTDPSHFDADCVDSSEWSMYVERRCDREFIAHARADIPALLDHIERLQAKVDGLAGLVEWTQKHYAYKHPDWDLSLAKEKLAAILNGAGNESEGG
jgi:hypothetical protein